MRIGGGKASLNTRLEWDAKAMKVTNIPSANTYLRRAEYRKGWEL